jgi:hypothetical protein
MSLFGKLVRTAVNVVALPIEVAKDVVTLGNIASGDRPYTLQRIEQLKREAEDEE